MRSGADTVQVETCVDKPKPSSVSHHLLLEDAGGLREKLAAPRRGGRVADMGRRQVRESSVGDERASAHLTPLRTRRACALAKTCPSRHRIQPPSLNFGA